MNVLFKIKTKKYGAQFQTQSDRFSDSTVIWIFKNIIFWEGK